jgi:hypothetical protein
MRSPRGETAPLQPEFRSDLVSGVLRLFLDALALVLLQLFSGIELGAADNALVWL